MRFLSSAGLIGFGIAFYCILKHHLRTRKKAILILALTSNLIGIIPAVLNLQANYLTHIVEFKSEHEFASQEDQLERLLKILNNGSLNDRLDAVLALGKIKNPKAVDALINALKDNDSLVRDKSEEALVNIGILSVDSLIATLKGKNSAFWGKDKNLYVRIRAIDVLGQIKDLKTVNILIATLNDRSPYVRESAALALGKIRDNRAVEPLIVMLKDKHYFVRQQAIRALGKIGDNRAVEPLSKFKYNIIEQHDVIEALKKIGDETAAEILISMLQTNKISYVRSEIEYALAYMGLPAVKGVILTLDNNDHEFLRSVKSILCKVNDPMVAESLIEILKIKAHDKTFHSCIEIKLRQFKGPYLVKPLLKLLLNNLFQNKNIEIQKIAISLLGEIEDPNAVSGLITALHYGSSDIQLSIELELAKITGQSFSSMRWGSKPTWQNWWEWWERNKETF